MKQTLGTPRYRPPVAAIRFGRSDRQPEETRYGRILVWYMRALAILWFLQGGFHWWLVLGGDPGSDPLTRLRPMNIEAIVFFCIIDFIAAVGLWLAAPWGGIVWFVAILAQWFTTVMLPRFLPYDMMVAAAGVALVAAYGFLLLKAMRENAPYT